MFPDVRQEPSLEGYSRIFRAGLTNTVCSILIASCLHIMLILMSGSRRLKSSPFAFHIV